MVRRGDANDVNVFGIEDLAKIFLFGGKITQFRLCLRREFVEFVGIHIADERKASRVLGRLNG
jgi:hypothetical protein